MASSGQSWPSSARKLRKLREATEPWWGRTTLRETRFDPQQEGGASSAPRGWGLVPAPSGRSAVRSDACGEGEGEGEGQEPAAVGSAHLLDFSDEILLHILSHVPSTDLVLNVRLTCRKLATLCLDKSLTHTVLLRKDYEASEDKVKRLVTAIGREVRELDLTGCYWLSGAAVERVGRCRALVRVGLSGCPLSAARLSRVLPALPQLRALALDVGPGFDAAQLSAECRAALGRVRELKQTLLAPSYGVVPCCGRLEKLLLYLELPDRARDGGAALSGQQLVGQSTVPRYQHLRVFYARLAPGLTNQEVARLFLAALSHRTPPHLRAFVLAAPGGLAESGAGRQLLEGMARHVALDALQLPRSWLGAASPAAAASSAASPAAGPPPPPPPQPRLGRPEHLSLRRCALPGGLLLRRLLQAGRDLRALASLDLSGCAHCLAPDALAGRADDDIDSGVLEALVAACAGLRHLNLSAAHHHSAPGDARHLCRLLGRLRRLRSLALPVCALAEPPAPAPPPGPGPGPAPAPPPAPLLRAPGKRVRTGVPAEPRPDAVAGSAFAALLRALPGLERLELIGSNFSSAMPRLEPAIRNALPPCARAHAVGDAEVAAVGQLAFLRHLTLAQLPGVLTGAGLLAVALRCQQLQSLSLANLGLAGKVVYAGALADALRHCQRLRDLRLEQPYFSANAQFFQALSQCPALQRLCLVSRSGTLQPDAVLAFVARCVGLVACHLFTGESLTTCRSLQQSLRSFQAERPALNVVIFPLLHEGLTDVIRDVPMVHLDEITLFKSKVAEEPPNLWW